MFSLKPLPHKEACKFIADKPVVSRQVFDELLPEFRAKAFVITGVEDFDLVQTIKDQIAKLPAGGDYEDIVDKIESDLAPWLGKAAPRRAELLVRWHGFQAYATAQHQAISRQEDIFPMVMYVSSEDSRVRPGHAALDRVVAPANSPFWDRHTPPWEPLCRCDKIALTHDDVDTMRQEDAHLPPTRRRVQEGPLLAALEQSDIVHGEVGMIGGQQVFLRGPGQDQIQGAPRSEGVSPGKMQWSPNDVVLSPVQILGRYDAQVAQDFTDWAQRTPVDGKGTTAWDWMNGKKVHKSPPPGWPMRPQPQPQNQPAKKRAAKKVATPNPSPLLTYAEGMREVVRTANFSRQSTIGGGINTSLKLGNGIEVVFKPKSGEYGQTLRSGIKIGEQYLREKAASIIDEELGTNLVPPTEIITHNGEVGSAQVFRQAAVMPNSMMSADRKKAMKAIPLTVRHDWQLLDDLIMHQDRHNGNLLLTVNPGGPTDVALIDNGLSLPENQDSFNGGKRFNAAGLDGRIIPAAQLARLNDFIGRESEIRARLAGLLNDAAIDKLFDKAKALQAAGIYGSSGHSLGNTL